MTSRILTSTTSHKKEPLLPTLEVFARLGLREIDGAFCEFGAGDVDLTALLRQLADSGYAGRFTVEYEGDFDGTVRLYQSVQRARAAVGRHTIS